MPYWSHVCEKGTRNVGIDNGREIRVSIDKEPLPNFLEWEETMRFSKCSLSQLTTNWEESGIIVTPVKRIADKRWRWHGRPVTASKMWEGLTEGCWRACVTSLADTAPWRFCAGCKLTSPYRAWIFPTPGTNFEKYLVILCRSERSFFDPFVLCFLYWIFV